MVILRVLYTYKYEARLVAEVRKVPLHTVVRWILFKCRKLNYLSEATADQNHCVALTVQQPS